MPRRLDGWVATSDDWNEERAYEGATRDLALGEWADACADDVGTGWSGPGRRTVRLYERPEVVDEDDPDAEDLVGYWDADWSWALVERVPTERVVVEVFEIDGTDEASWREVADAE